MQTIKTDILEVLEFEIDRQKIREELTAELGKLEVSPTAHESSSPAVETLLRYRVANTRELRDLLNGIRSFRRLREAPLRIVISGNILSV